MSRIAVCATLFLAVSFAQPPAAQSEGPRFEVVSIKPASPRRGRSEFSRPGRPYPDILAPNRRRPLRHVQNLPGGAGGPCDTIGDFDSSLILASFDSSV
jgi:hypothetical protein